MHSFCATPDYMVSTATSSSKMTSMHYHASYELYYLAVGNREYFVDDKLFSVYAGDFVLIPPGRLHRTGGEYGERTLVGFTHEFLTSVFSEETAKELVRCFDHVKLTPNRKQQDMCKYLLKKLSASQDKTESALHLAMLLLELNKCNDPDIENDFVGKIVGYINRSYAEITSIGQIAEQFFISKYHLCRIFKNAMKITIIEYLNHIRIKNACQLLDFSDKDIGQISELCGFNSMAYFSNVFKKITGQSPSDYRRSSQKERGGAKFEADVNILQKQDY